MVGQYQPGGEHQEEVKCDELPDQRSLPELEELIQHELPDAGGVSRQGGRKGRERLGKAFRNVSARPS